MSAWRSASLKSRATPRRGDQPAFPDSAVACRPRDTRTRNPSDEPEGVRWSAKRQREEVERFWNYLNTMGADGWEMVCYESVPMTGNFTGNVKGYAYLTFFKRQTS